MNSRNPLKSPSKIYKRKSKKFFLPFKALLKWFEKTQRKLPWREDAEPYKIWISEVMSQQSTLKTVVPYFERWIVAFPTLESLAQANEEAVLKLWAGLGYYSRARNILKTARLLVEKASWPQNLNEWGALPGIGPYTAAAILAIAFNKALIPVDGNILRVFSRYWGIENPLNNIQDRKMIEAALTELCLGLSREGFKNFSQLSQALMELGALVCRPRAGAECKVCPLIKNCRAYQSANVSRYPRVKERKAMQKLLSLGILYRSPKGLLLRKIPRGKRLAGQWEVPLFHLGTGSAEQNVWLRNLGRYFELRGPIKHSITHHAYKVYAVEAGPWHGPAPKGHAFMNSAELFPGTLTTLTQKICKSTRTEASS